MHFLKNLLKYTAIVVCGVLLGLAVCAGVQWFWRCLDAGTLAGLPAIVAILVCLIVGLSVLEG